MPGRLIRSCFAPRPKNVSELYKGKFLSKPSAVCAMANVCHLDGYKSVGRITTSYVESLAAFLQNSLTKTVVCLRLSTENCNVTSFARDLHLQALESKLVLILSKRLMRKWVQKENFSAARGSPSPFCLRFQLRLCFHRLLLGFTIFLLIRLKALE